ncbi:unnamed protein product [Caenorhabditis angaria]|uniref:Uncharacterized protein n=1 Tax=Caenorhabditis angaria TaxID=860376 RepID=A0A9P1J103_9PELO|nr:unnamed protein product [Caenorhabditis angaria]
MTSREKYGAKATSWGAKATFWGAEAGSALASALKRDPIKCTIAIFGYVSGFRKRRFFVWTGHSEISTTFHGKDQPNSIMQNVYSLQEMAERTALERSQFMQIVVQSNNVEKTTKEHEFFIDLCQGINNLYITFEDNLLEPSNLPQDEHGDRIQKLRQDFLIAYDIIFYHALNIVQTNSFNTFALNEFDNSIDALYEIEQELEELMENYSSDELHNFYDLENEQHSETEEENIVNQRYL